MMLYSIQIVSMLIGIDMYLGNSNEYLQVCVQYPYVVALPMPKYVSFAIP